MRVKTQKVTILLISVINSIGAIRFALAESQIILSAQSALTKRIVKRFDFNERPLGNLEDTPMFWVKVTGKGFPHFVNGKIDEQIGEPAPSFKLQLNGGNLGYLFTARKIPAFPGSDHKIIAKVKLANIKYAKGFIEAFYLDRFGNPLKDTIRYSKLIPYENPSSTLSTDSWQTISIYLPFSNPAGRFIGLGVFLVQSDHLPDVFNMQNRIFKKDIYATMWIDEITIIRLPQARLTLQTGKLIYDSDQSILISVLVADPSPDDLSARMILTDHATQRAIKWDIPIKILPPIEAILEGKISTPKSTNINLGKLLPGQYTIKLDVLTGKQVIISRNLDFAVINHYRQQNPSNNFGIDLLNADISNIEEILDFVSLLKPGWTLVPFWREDLPAKVSKSQYMPADTLTTALKQQEIKVLAGFVGIPKNIKIKEKIVSPSIWDLFASSDKVWKVPLASLLSRHADKIDIWVFGRINHYWQNPDSRIKNILSNLKKYFSQFQGTSIFVVAWPAMRNLTDEKIADNYFIQIPCELLPGSFENYFLQWKRFDFTPIISLKLQNLQKFQLNPAVIDFVNRIINAKKCQIKQIAVSNLWTIDSSSHLMPNAYFPAYTNIIDRLAGTEYLGEIEFAPSKKGLLFGNSQHALLIIRSVNKEKSIIGKISIGDDLVAYDLWGRKLPIIYNKDDWIVPYHPILFIDGISPELASFISTIKFSQKSLTSKFGIHRISLVFKNTFGQTITGLVRIKGSKYWRFDPSGARFILTPGNKFELPMKLRFPTNEPIGQKTIRVSFDFEERKRIHLNLFVPLNVSSSELRMRILWFMREDKLVVLQEIRNYSKSYADLKAFLIAPNRPRMERQIRKLAPGQFAVKEYIVGSWKQLFGKKIRIGFREIRGTRMANEIITIE